MGEQSGSWVERSANLGTRIGIPETVQSPNCKLVYLYLAMVPNADIEELHDRLNIDLLTLYPVLSRLEESGHVLRDGVRFRLGPLEEPPQP